MALRDLPNDIPTLMRWGQMAMDSGETDAMEEIAQKIDLLKQYEKDKNVNTEEGTGAWEKFLIGMGRGFMDMAQGAKQKYLMATDPEQAKQYTEDVNKEVQRFESDFPGIGPESFGRFAGWAAPGAVTGGLGGAGMIGAAALESGIMPTEHASWQEAGTNALIGAGTAGILKGGQAAYRAARGMPEVTPEALSGIQYAADKGYKLRPHNYANTQPRRTGAIIADKSMLSNASERTLQEGRDAIDELGVRWRGANTQQELKRGIDVMEAQNRQTWRDFHGVYGDIPVRNLPIEQQILNEITALQQSGGGGRNIKRLARLWDDLPKGKNGQPTIEDLHNFRKNFAEEYASSWAKKGITPGIAKRMYATISAEIERAAKTRPGGIEAWNQANQTTARMKQLLDQSGVPYKVREGKIELESGVLRIALGNDADRARALEQLMSARGVEGVKAAIADEIYRAATNGQRIVGPGSAARAIDKLMTSARTFMSPDELAELRGLRNYMDLIKGEAREVANLATGQRVVDVAKGGMAVASLSNPSVALGFLATEGLIPFLMRRRDASAILMKLANSQNGSKLQAALTRELNRIVAEVAHGGSAAVANDPMQIEIRNGVAQ